MRITVVIREVLRQESEKASKIELFRNFTARWQDIYQLADRRRHHRCPRRTVSCAVIDYCSIRFTTGKRCKKSTKMFFFV